MTADRRSSVFVAVPVYRGQDFVGDTLRSILAQTHRDLRVLIAVDGNDAVSAEACAPFTGDERVRLVVHERQLGWVDNLNWLIDACDGDYYCYWQQDDTCAPDYLEKLVEALRSHPAASCAYSDLRWFGRTSNEVALATVAGSTKERILTQIERQSWLPLRALVPADVLRRVGHVQGLDALGYAADKLWSLRLAAVGDMIRVPEVLYFKRDHAESFSHSESTRHELTEREAWLDLGVELFAVAAPHFDEHERQDLLATIAERLVVPRPGRTMRYQVQASQDTLPFLDELFTAIGRRSGVESSLVLPRDGSESALRALRGQRDGAPEGSALRILAGEVLVEAERPALVEQARSNGALVIDCSQSGPARTVLLDGWSPSESWGTWSVGRSVRLWLPIPGDGARWRVVLAGQLYVGSSDVPHRQRIVIRQGQTVALDHGTSEEAPIPGFELVAVGDREPGVYLDVEVPTAVSPADLGTSPDQRALGLALSRIELTRVE